VSCVFSAAQLHIIMHSILEKTAATMLLLNKVSECKGYVQESARLIRKTVLNGSFKRATAPLSALFVRMYVLFNFNFKLYCWSMTKPVL
jgi:hypothetical protein